MEKQEEFNYLEGKIAEISNMIENEDIYWEREKLKTKRNKLKKRYLELCKDSSIKKIGLELKLGIGISGEGKQIMTQKQYCAMQITKEEKNITRISTEIPMSYIDDYFKGEVVDRIFNQLR